jgi:hypothetical protein
MKQTNQFWTLPQLFDEVFRRAGTGENIYLIPFSDKFRNSHFSILKAIIETINNQENARKIQ